MNTLWSDVRLALRTLRKAPGFTAAAVVVLALSIGPNTAIFSIVYGTMLAPMPYPDPDRLVMVWSTTGTSYTRTSVPDYRDWKEQATSFEYLEVYRPREINVQHANGLERTRARQVSADGHRLLGEGVFLGRDFAPDESSPGKDRVALLTHKFWQQSFDGDRGVLGREIAIDSIPHSVIGILPPGPQDRRPANVWMPLATTPDHNDRESRIVNVMGRLKPGVTIERAQQEMNVIANELARRYPASNREWGVRVEPFKNNFFEASAQKNLWLLLAAVSFVVLIACVNIAHLLLSRGMARAREIAIRAALGASRGALVRFTLTESLVLALMGGGLGVLSSIWILQSIVALVPSFQMSAEADPQLSLPVLAFTAVTTLLCGLLFGSVAVWHAGRVDFTATLKQGGHGHAGSSRQRLRHAFVLAQFALAVTLLGGAGLTIYSFWNRMRADLGMNPDRVLTMSLTLPEQRFGTDVRMTSFYQQLLAAIQAVPGVAHASLTTDIPLTGSPSTVQFSIVGQGGDTASRKDARLEVISPDYFATFRIPLGRGRGFTQQDPGGAPVAVVNEQFVSRFLAGTDPLGQRILLQERAGKPAPVDWLIVGVAADVASPQFGDRPAPKIYVPFWQRPPRDTSLAIQTVTDPEGMRKSIAAAVASLDAELPVARVRTMQRIIDERFAPDRLNMALYGGLASIALLLAAVGIYGAMSFMVTLRKPEIGVRIALGAERRQVLLQVLGEGLALAGVGLTLGLAGAYGLGRVMQSSLYGTGALSLPVWAGVSVVLLVTAAIACYLPARRASSVDPLVLLRNG